MRIESGVTSVTWIPSEAVTGMAKLPFEAAVAHYDEPPPDRLGDVEALRAADRLRFANVLRAFIEVEDGHITGYGQEGRGLIGSTTLRLGTKGLTFAAVSYDDLRPDPEVGDGWVKFTQTAGGRTGVPAPRTVRHPPYVQIAAPTAWTTLALTLHNDGRSEGEITGASPFPRHWVYDGHGSLIAKTGLIDYKEWWTTAFGPRTPWGGADREPIVAESESELERRLSVDIMRGADRPEIRNVPAGTTLMEQGEAGHEMYLVLDGVLVVEVDGSPVAQVGPGALIGERALIEGGRRTATVRATTPLKLAVVDASALTPDDLGEVAEGHRREDG